MGILKDVFLRLKERDFSGNTGLAIKNTVYQFFSGIASKAGALVFTILVARLLKPEMYGLYALALSTILIFGSFSDLGIGQTMIRFIAKALGNKKPGRAKAYFVYFSKIKLVLAALSLIALFSLAKFLAQNYYQKPIFLALLAGLFYILFLQVTVFLQALLQASNYFNGLLYKEVVFQISRLLFLIPFLFLIPKLGLETEKNLFFIILLLSASLLVTGIFLLLVIVKKINFLKVKSEKLSDKNYKEINNFLLWTSSLALSGMFFTYIDKIMLGRFVAAEFIGYYEAATVLIGSALTPLLFGTIAGLLPIFSRMKGKSAQRGFEKSLKIILPISLALAVITVILAKPIILIIYGHNYLNSINILRLSSVLIVTLAVNSIYSTYLLSQDKPKIVAGLLVLSTLVNVGLNYFLITRFLQYGPLFAVYGVALATFLGQIVYLIGLSLYYRKIRA